MKYEKWHLVPEDGVSNWMLKQNDVYNGVAYNDLRASDMHENPHSINVKNENEPENDSGHDMVYMSIQENGEHALFKSEMTFKNIDADAVFIYLMSNGSRTVGEFQQHYNIQHEENDIDVPLQEFEFCQLEKINDYEDIIHLRHMKSLYVFPSWTERRDYCLHRSWSVEQDGSYTILLKPVAHRCCPLVQGYVRGEMYAKYRIISQQTELMDGFLCNDNGKFECLLKQKVKLNPKGWIPSKRFLVNGRSCSFCDFFSLYTLRNFVKFSNQNNSETLEPDDRFIYPERVSMSHQKALEHLASFHSEIVTKRKIVVEKPNDKKSPQIIYDEFTSKFVDLSPVLDRKMWSSTAASLWKVRGKHYMNDRKKYQSDEALFRLIAVDLVEVSKPILSGFCNHPSERVQKALKEEKENGNKLILPPFLIAFNIFIPGPPYYHLIVYYEVQESMMDEIRGKANTPFSNLAGKFFFGDDDVFRDTVFKLFPRLDQGNFVVRNAVGKTPALIGKRLKQYYHRTERYFELVIDMSSKARAAGIIKLSKGFAKSLVVDMAFGLEGNNESELPERIMGCCRLNNISFDDLRYVYHPDDLRDKINNVTK